jgi:hypothetical protein
MIWIGLSVPTVVSQSGPLFVRPRPFSLRNLNGTVSETASRRWRFAPPIGACPVPIGWRERMDIDPAAVLHLLREVCECYPSTRSRTPTAGVSVTGLSSNDAIIVQRRGAPAGSTRYAS